MSQGYFPRNCVILTLLESGQSFSSVVHMATLYYTEVRETLQIENQSDFLNRKAFPKC